MATEISSVQNPRIKNVVLLQSKQKERTKQKLFVTEGYREAKMAVESGYAIHTFFYCNEFLTEESRLLLDSVKLRNEEKVSVSKEVFNKMAYRDNKDGALLILHQKSPGLDDIHLRANPLILVLESIEKPGNIGAVLRTADAADVDAVILSDCPTDMYNPNIVRSSLGCIFTNQVVSAAGDEIISWLNKNQITIFAAELNASKSCYDCDLTGSTAIAMGAEATGLSPKWLKASDQNIIIPMKGKVDSLNVSNATAILSFEAVRQRLEKGRK